MYILVRNFLTFPKYQRQKFWSKFEFKFFNPTPPEEGGIKNEVIEKLARELTLQNMIFQTHKNKAKSKRWALYLQNWASYMTFCELTQGKISFSLDFQILQSLSFFDISTKFCVCELNFYIGPTSIQQPGVQHNSFIDFLGEL